MVRILVDRPFSRKLRYVEAVGMSHDDKPNCSKMVTGSTFFEVDTGIKYAYDEESKAWIPTNSGNGKTSIADATVTLGEDLTYTGEEQTQAVSTVKIGSTTLTESTDYEVVNNKATEIGTYTLHIVGKGSYTGVVPKEFSIGEAQEEEPSDENNTEEEQGT